MLPGSPPLPLSRHSITGLSTDATTHLRGTQRHASSAGDCALVVATIPIATNALLGGRGCHTKRCWSPTCEETRESCDG